MPLSRNLILSFKKTNFPVSFPRRWECDLANTKVTGGMENSSILAVKPAIGLHLIQRAGVSSIAGSPEESATQQACTAQAVD